MEFSGAAEGLSYNDEADGAAVPLMAAVKAAAHPGMPRQVRKLEDSPMRSVRAADFSPMKSSPVVLEAMVAITESAPELRF